MTLVISNVKQEFVEKFKDLASKIHADVEICESEREIPNAQTMEAIRLCGNSESTEYANFGEFWQEMEREVNAEIKN
ncbi:hypothetical protein [Helicobacter trogontum]|uniref:Uncharacterized protein n=1 Tax=Helicobacter trogontum TaxID=50960 RepID=A0A099VD80_9HELI|nr:hypothetical protein [Helicobacter trogontum]TLD84662.1 hypothetical protein LS81_001240 [Helicobacter trogontum]